MRSACRFNAWLLGLVLALWAYGAAAAGVAPIRIGDLDRGPLALDGSVELLEDPAATRTLEDVAGLRSGVADGFHPATVDRLHRGFSASAVWLRLSLTNDAAQARSARMAFNVTWLQHVDFHVLRQRDGQAAWTHEQAGVSDPMDAIHRRQRVPQLAIDLRPHESVRVLARVKSAGQSKLVLELHTADRWQRLERNHALLSGLLIGGLLVFCVYSLSLWWISRARMLAFQAAGFALVALYEATYRGYARIVLWPDSTEWSYRAHSVTVAGAALCLMLYFHERSRRSPVRVPGRRFLMALAAVEVAVLLGTWWGPYAAFAPVGIVNAPLIVLALTVCTALYRRRGGPGSGLAMAIMAVICLGGLLRMTSLMFATPWVSGLDLYALALPGMLVGLFAVTSWSYQQTRQRADAQRTLTRWQDQEQQRLEREAGRKTHALSEALDQAELRTREQKELLACISHDLRAPMATIIGNLRLMQDAPGAFDARAAAIERSATDQLELIDDLVRYAKEDLLPLSLEELPVHLQTLVDDMAQYADVLARRQGNAFELQVEGGLPQAVYLDSRRVQQVVLNLLSNAAKFTRHGRIRLGLRAFRVDDAWQLDFEVADSGAGIDAAQLGRMTQALAADAPGPQGGLGLLIAQRIVRKMRGQLSIRSGTGESSGTRVTFSLVARPVPQRLQSSLWPAAAGARPAGPRDRRLRPLPPMAPLSAAQKRELEGLARDGRWSDLHAWADRLAGEERYRALVQAVRQALDRLDFEHIRLIARAAPEHGA